MIHSNISATYDSDSDSDACSVSPKLCCLLVCPVILLFLKAGHDILGKQVFNVLSLLSLNLWAYSFHQICKNFSPNTVLSCLLSLSGTLIVCVKPLESKFSTSVVCSLGSCPWIYGMGSGPSCSQTTLWGCFPTFLPLQDLSSVSWFPGSKSWA